MPKYSAIVNINLEFIIIEKNEEQAKEKLECVELPKEYVTDSFELVKIGKINKDGSVNY